MSLVDIEHLRRWVGTRRTDRDVLRTRHARLMAATLGQPAAPLVAGAPLPPLWHWIYFLEGLPPSELGRDGHAARGGFLPPVPLINRMWAGGRLEFHVPLTLDSEVVRNSQIASVDHKHGHSGELVFVSVQHEISHGGRAAVTEVHDIVYGGLAPVSSIPTIGRLPPAVHAERVVPDSTMLFRYSALTFNGHRIHYDVDYCREVEGYPNLVIHGPLTATLLAGCAQRAAGRPLKRFSYRGLQPSVLGSELSVNAAVADGPDRFVLWAALPNGAVTMRAEAGF